jgi:isoquinoline 1-oxidoreductase alpha subunit
MPTVRVNGVDHQFDGDPQLPLLWYLRDFLGLTGSKFGCGMGLCGACTVHIDGKAVYACTRTARDSQGKKITTVESLKNGDKVDPVVTGFVQHDASQCGFCTPGFVMAVRAYLNGNPKATLDDVRGGLGGNICRCGTYNGITACALELAKKGGA